MNFVAGIFGLLLMTQLGKHFFLPFSYLSGIRIDYLAPTLYATDLVSFILIGALIHDRKFIWSFIRPYLNKFQLSIGVGIVCLIANAVIAPSKELWLYSVMRTLQWIGVGIFFIRYGKNKSIITSLFHGILIGAVIQLVLTLSQLSLRHSLEGVFYWLGERRFSITTPSIAKAVIAGKEFLRPYGTFSHPNSLAGFYLLVYAVVLTQKNTMQITIRSLLLFCSSALIMISFSRTALVVYAVITLLYFLRLQAKCKWCTLAKFTVATFLLVFAFSITGDRQSFEKRVDFADKAVRIIIQNPTTGVGFGNYLIAQHTYPQQFPTFFEQPVHSIYLYSVAQLGIPLAFLLFSCIAIAVYKYLNIYSFVYPLSVVALTGALDHYWLTLPQNLFLSAAIFGILIAIHEKQISGNR